jgi:hypothetical protein
MDSKTLRNVDVKAGDKGEVTAVFATFNVIDKDGDVTLPGAFKDGTEVLISAYQHQSWGGALPVGKGRIRTTKTEAILEGNFFMDTIAGRDTFTVVKNLGPRQQWSYSLADVTAERGKFDGKDVQFLKTIHVDEVSPVLVGAGVNTRTLETKAAGDNSKEAVRAVDEYNAAIRPHETPVTTKRWDGTKTYSDIPDTSTVDDLRAVHAYVDPSKDPTVKSSYGFLHHDSVDAEANLRACLVGIADLNGLKGADLSDAERRAVYNHLAQHLQDGDRDVPDLRTPGETGALKFHEEAAVVLAGLDNLITRTSEVMALRRSKGKAISASTVDVLEWVYDGTKRLRALLDTPQEDAEREYARFVAQTLRLNQENS